MNMPITSAIAGFCEKRDIAGAIRRQKPVVSDIEIVSLQAKAIGQNGTDEAFGQQNCGTHPFSQPAKMTDAAFLKQ